MKSGKIISLESLQVLLGSPVDALLDGKYRLERVLGRGGMGIVVAAYHLELRRSVAIKLLLPAALGKQRSAERLMREARAAAKLHGPHVARVYDVGQVNGGGPYIVMEYLEGQTLAVELDEKGRLEPSVAVDYALYACEALAEAHAAQIVHRDLKPSNIFLASGPGRLRTLKILDFGIAKAVESESLAQQTNDDALLGTPAYMSPEQLLNAHDVDARADIWALGVVLYECLSGRQPFQGKSLPELCSAILGAPLQGLTANTSVPPALERVVFRCLSRNASDRYFSVAALAADLAAFASERGKASLATIEALLSNLPMDTKSMAESVAPVGVTPPHTERGTAHTLSPTSSRTLGASLVLALVIAIALFVYGRNRASEATVNSAEPRSARSASLRPGDSPARSSEAPASTAAEGRLEAAPANAPPALVSSVRRPPKRDRRAETAEPQRSIAQPSVSAPAPQSSATSTDPVPNGEPPRPAESDDDEAVYDMRK